MIEANISILVAAYNRPDSLSRVLSSLKNARYPEDKKVELIISLDYCNEDEVLKVAEAFDWKFGDKKIIKHPKNLGLKEHILSCGDLLFDNREAVILLEDDLFVAPEFYNYCTQTLDFFKTDERICGIALYAHNYNETGFMRFNPARSKYANYFMQVPCSWGQLWTRNQWGDFKSWYNKNDDSIFEKNLLLPRDVLKWPKTSWKKYFFQYMLENDKFFVYPYDGYSTNFADVGTHHFDERTTLQIPISTAKEENFNFGSLDDEVMVYDSHCEISPCILKNQNQRLRDFDFDVDLYGSKSEFHLNRPYVITGRPISSKLEISFARSLKPHEMNICFDIGGKHFSLVESSVLKQNIELGDGVSDIDKNSYYFGIPKDYLKIEYDLEEKTDDVMNKAQDLVYNYNEYQELKKSKVYRFLKWIRIL